MCKPSDPRGLHLADQPNATKKHLIIMPTFVDVPEIKLIRTDTTLDLSQKAEKVCFSQCSGQVLKAATRPKRLWMASSKYTRFTASSKQKRCKGVHRGDDR